MLHIRVTPTIRLDRQATKEIQHYPQPQAPTQVPDCMYFRGAQTQKHKKGVRVHSNDNQCIK